MTFWNLRDVKWPFGATPDSSINPGDNLHFPHKARRGRSARGLQHHPEELRRVAAQGVRGQGGDRRDGAREEHPGREGLPRAAEEDVRLQRARLIHLMRVE